MNVDIWEERYFDEPRREGDTRSEWERDYARVIHSAAFRRLQAKTQVLGLGESDFYRTRLTHSMEVAQIGVGILNKLQYKHSAEQEILAALPDPALMNAICLAHDIGHPPFGHGGEVALNLCMRDYGGFEGNGQTLRIISKLEKYTQSNGMNPTRRLMLGVLKYPSSYLNTVREDAYGEVPALKWMSKAAEQKPPKCYLNNEVDLVNWILEPLTQEEKESFIEVMSTDNGVQNSKPCHLKPKYKGLDTSIMELADDISYSLHDLEDAISLGMITLRDWNKHNSEPAMEQFFIDCELDSESVGEKLFSENSFERKKMIGDLVHMFICSVLVEASGVSNATTPLIKWNANMEPKYNKLRCHIFNLVVKKVIKSPNVQQLEFKGQKLVMELFDILSSDPKRLLPVNTLHSYNKCDEYQTEEIKNKEKMRVICDFIAGMTDEYATRFYEKLYYPHKGSIFDRL